MKNITPPRIAEWLLRRITKSQEKFSVLGDYEEEFFALAEDEGLKVAKSWYWKQMLESIVPFIIQLLHWRFAMVGNYFKVAFRNIRKHKGYSFINIAGLAIGMACCILLVLFIRAELSIDSYHVHKDRIYRLCTHVNIGGTDIRHNSSNAVSAGVLKEEYPEVVDAVRFRFMGSVTVSHEEQSISIDETWYTDPSAFDIFSWPILKGDPATVLEAPYSIVISEDVAEGLFEGEDPIGRIIQLNDRSDYTVTGVMKNIPENSTLEPDALCSFSTLYTMGAVTEPMLTAWTSFNFNTYLLLGEGVNAIDFENKIRDQLHVRAGEELEAKGATEILFLQPLKDIYLRPLGQSSSPIFYVYIFSAVALFILLIACVNFMNLSTARSTNRAVEVGMRKVMGAHRGRLIQQFLSEAWILSLLSLIVGLILVQIALPFLRTLTGHRLPFQLLRDPELAFGLLGLAVFTGFIAGSYPAFLLSAFRPVRILKGKMRTSTMSSRFRQVLVVTQFSISIALIVGTLMIMQQLTYMRHRDPGFNKDHLVVLRIEDDQVRRQREVLKEAFISHTGIMNAASTSSLPPWGCATNDKLPEGYTREEVQLMDDITVDEDFVETMGMTIIEGRDFSKAFPGDINHSVLINETAAKRYGWEDPVGKIIYVYDIRAEEGYGPRTVIGVVNDFNIRGMYNTVDPMIINWDPDYPFDYGKYWYLLVRIQGGQMEESLRFLEATWKKIVPDKVFNYFFLSETYDRQFLRIERSRSIFSYFTFLAIFIACLGLFGMASFTAEKRTKEIGIRKVLGASTRGVVVLLSRELLFLVMAANILAWPVAYFWTRGWLEGFPYRIDITFVPFAVSATLILIISFLTISYQAVRAALANPVDALRYE